ncbi:hypothetical protein [Priestia megaterium]|uniref:hypothetical protein n=1 Tax=Priestia megaterium TaxID=1404 RepID=UPI002E1E60ED|nr:hypothetical protein [Priestia megaterium]MED4102169.1 hypothetical protein [Priestia megaterium]MED4142596.1 hypothetical protein [Priestia megaterium]
MFNIFIVWTDGTPKTWYDRVKTKAGAQRIISGFEKSEPGYLSDYTVSVEPTQKENAK